jgi:Skp family chaperone for outer membrane proteins
MRRMQTGLGILSVLMAGMLSAFADGTSVAVVSMEKLIKSHPDTEPAEAVVQGQIDDFEAEKKTMQKTFEEAKGKFEDARKALDNTALSDTERAEKKTVAEDLLTDLRKMEQELSDTIAKRKKDINEQTGRMRKRIVEKIQGVIKAYASQNKFDLVLDKDALSVTGVAGVLYADEKNDITEAVLAEIAKKSKE